MNLTLRDIINTGLFVLLVGILYFGTTKNAIQRRAVPAAENFPATGAALPVRWGDTGKKLVESGAIDKVKLDALYASRGGLAPEDAALLDGSADTIIVTEKNAGYLLNLFWALGLANKNRVLDTGPMQNYGDPSRFASTGGWTLARGGAMDHYSMHPLITFTKEQQKLLERVAQGIYRPCCGNSTYFPDCNHGMAMLGFLELAASQGASEDELYRAALTLNRFWFPDTYRTLDAYFARQAGGKAVDLDPRVALSAEFSSALGYQRVLKEMGPQPSQGGSCGV